MSGAVEIRLPEVSGGTEAEQLRQLQSYLYDLAGQLQYAFDAVEQQSKAAEEQIRRASSAEKSPRETFPAIKALIIKSADIVESYSQQISRRLEGVYVAKSDYGTFAQETRQEIRENAEGIERSFRNLQEITTNLEAVRSGLRDVNAYIRTGLLCDREDGSSVYGVEIGQQETVDGAQTFRKFARLTSDRLGFYDSSDREVAYISDYRLYITAAEVGSLTARDGTLNRLHIGPYSFCVEPGGHLTVS